MESNKEILFNEIYQNNYDKILHYATKICLDEYLAQDLTQESFLSLFKNIDNFNNNREFSAFNWLRTTVKRKFIDSIKYKPQNLSKNQFSIDELLEKQNNRLDGNSNDLDKLFFNNHIFIELRDKGIDNKKILDNILNSIPVIYRPVFDRYYLQEKTMEEITKELKISKSKFKIHLYRAREEIKKYINKNYDTEDFMFSI